MTAPVFFLCGIVLRLSVRRLRVFPCVANVLTSVLAIGADIPPIRFELFLICLDFLLVAGFDIGLQVPAIGADFFPVGAEFAGVTANFLAIGSRGRVILAPCRSLRARGMSRNFLSGLSRHTAADCVNQSGNERRDLRVGHLYLLPLSRLVYGWARSRTFSLRDAPSGPVLTGCAAKNGLRLSFGLKKVTDTCSYTRAFVPG